MAISWSETEKCGILGIVGPGISLIETISAQKALEHRGNGPAGIALLYSDSTIGHFTAESIDQLPITDKSSPGLVAIAHNRYATSASTSMENTQPFIVSNKKFTLSLAHNGNIPQKCVEELKLLLQKKMSDEASDSAVMAQLLIELRPKYKSWSETFIQTLPLFKGAFSLICFTEEGYLYAIRDPYGIRPLCIGKKEERWIAASETVALDAIGAEYVREILPGEMMVLFSNQKSQSIIYAVNPSGNYRCLLESIYFSRKKSFDGNELIENQRRALGRGAARRFKAKHISVDWVVPILNSGHEMAIGAAEELNTPIFQAIGVQGKKRSFIQNTQLERVKAVYEKHIVWDPKYGVDIAGKSILLCDDSAVRGTSLEGLIQKIKDQPTHPGEIHVLLGSEPVADYCDLGVDLPDKSALLANRVGGGELMELEKKIAKFLGVSSVTYLDRTSVETALGKHSNEMCYHCFGGEHPVRAHRSPIYRKDHESLLKKIKILFLASGNGTNVESLLEKIKSKEVFAQPIGILTNNPQAGVVEKAKKYKVPVSIFSSIGKLKEPKVRAEYEETILAAILTWKGGPPDIIVLAGWMLVLPDHLLQELAKRKIRVVNIHPALLSGTGAERVISSKDAIPEIRGVHAIEKAFEYSLEQMPVTGVTIHYIDSAKKFDTGEVILKQEVCRRVSETLEDLETRIHETEHEIYSVALQKILLDQIP